MHAAKAEHKKKMADAKAAARHEKAAKAMRVRLKESHHGPHAMGERDRHDRSRQIKKQPRQKRRPRLQRRYQWLKKLIHYIYR